MDPAAGRGGLEDIVVTARRQAENLQRTPVSVSAISAKTLEHANITQIDKITQLIPNLSVQPTSGFIGGTSAYIRGIGSNEPLLTVDSPVGVYIDGVYVGRSNATDFGLVDLQRIEVLRGPQGTLFGRNTTGGAINMVTKDPSQNFGGAVKLGIANLDQKEAAARIETGEIGKSGITATISYRHLQHDGTVNNPFAPSGKDEPGALNSDSIWAKVRGQWGNFTATYVVDYNSLKGLPAATQTRFMSNTVRGYYTNTTGTDFLQYVSPNYLGSVGLAFIGRQNTRIWGHGLTLQLDVAPLLKFKSITGLRYYRGDPLPTLYSPPGVIGPTSTGTQEVRLFENTLKAERTNQVSQEFQVLGDSHGFKYVAGLYYFEEHGNTTVPGVSAFIRSPTLAVVTPSFQAYTFRAKSYAAFAQASYRPDFLKKLELTVGIRQTHDRKFVDQTAPTARIGNNGYDNTSVNVILSYDVTDHIMSFFRFGTGYRSGGFNPRASATQNFVYLPEKAKTYEAGIKTEFFDRMLRLNASAYRTDYDNLQVSQFVTSSAGSSGGFTSNASARFQGFEAELQLAPARGLTLSGSVGYVDPKYKVFIQPNPAMPGTFFNAANQSKFPYVPNWTANAGAQYEGADIGFGRPLATMNYSYLSKRYFFPNALSGNAFWKDIASNSFQKLDARVGLTQIPFGHTTADLSFYVENMLNRHNITSGIDFGVLGFAVNSYAPPRQYGLDLKLNF